MKTDGFQRSARQKPSSKIRKKVMYIPAANRMDDPQPAFDLIEAHGFATVISTKDGIPWASHLPVLLDRAGGSVRLRSHMARANEQWQHFHAAQEILCIFHGPHAYIRPSWYKSKRAVPTWNYATVHVYGVPVVETESESLRRIVEDTTAKYENGFSEPWELNLPDATTASLMKAMVGFSVSITRIETKFKLGHNRPDEDQEAMMEALEASPEPDAAALAAFTRAHKKNRTQEASERGGGKPR